MRLKKYQKQISQEMQELRNKLPKYSTRSELETEMAINKYRAIARKKQIALQKIDNEIKPYSISTYMIKEKRKNLLEWFGLIIRNMFLGLKELKP